MLQPLPNSQLHSDPLYLRAVEAKRPVWTDPHVIRAGVQQQQQQRTTFSQPIIVNDKVIGVVAAATTLQSAFGRLGGPPATRPAEIDSGALLREFAIINNDGRVIYPSSRDASVVEWAKSNNMPALADDLTAVFEGENSGVKVYRLHDAPDIIPGGQSGEYYWVAFAPIATTDWVVTSAISETQYMSPIVQRLWHRALFLVGGLAVLLIVTTFVSIRVSRPIEKMARAVNELAQGNLDAHVTEVQSHDELGQLASAFNTMTGQLKQHVAALTEQTAARETVEAELRIARQIQTDLLPKTFPPFPSRNEFDLYAVNVPAHRVAGDFYDFFFTPDDLLTIVIADVSGKGVPAALLMAVTRTIVRNLAMEGLTPGQIAERANAMLIQDISDSMFVTMFLCQYDTKTGRIVYVNAGHPKPYCFGATGDPREFGDVTGALLGVNPVSADWAYEQREGQLEIGQTLLLFTDGVTEARSPDGQMLRNAGVEQLIRQHQTDDVDHLCKGLVEDVTVYQAGQPADDVTLVALKRKR
jgi:sigma-B regulation protein RsbU (phosphoserine phosphatase)